MNVCVYEKIVKGVDTDDIIKAIPERTIMRFCVNKYHRGSKDGGGSIVMYKNYDKDEESNLIISNINNKDGTKDTSIKICYTVFTPCLLYTSPSPRD